MSTKTMTKANLLTVVIALTLATAAAPGATWDGGGDGVTWSDRFNWSGDTVPGGGSDIGISGPATITLNTRAPSSGNFDGWGFGTGVTVNITSTGAFYGGRSGGGEPVATGAAIVNVNGGTFSSSYFNWNGLTINASGAANVSVSGGRDYNANQRNGTLSLTGSVATVNAKHYDSNHWFDFHDGFDTRFVADVNGVSTIIFNSNGQSRGLIIGSQADLYIDLTALTTTGTWTLINADQGLGANEKFVEHISGVPTGWTAAVTYDTANSDVLLTVVPEPATMALLAVGGLGALARHRRRA